ncbi:MAG: putrescine ABC transporter permease PotH, partial [Pseudomonas protegens]
MSTFNQKLFRMLPSGRKLVIGIPFLWLFLFFMLPFFLVMKISFSEAALAIPPYSEIYSYAEQKFQLLLNLGNYAMLAGDELYISAYLGSLKVALLSTLMCLVVGFPMAYAISKTGKETQNVLLLLIMMPTWTAILIRVYAWMGILSNNG